MRSISTTRTRVSIRRRSTRWSATDICASCPKIRSRIRPTPGRPSRRSPIRAIPTRSRAGTTSRAARKAPRSTARIIQTGSPRRVKSAGKPQIPALVRAVTLIFAILGVTACASTMGRTANPRPARVPDIGFEPTSYAVAHAMLELARVGPSDVVYDLGSGDGRIVNLAAQVYGARGVGIELQPYLVDVSRRAARESGVSGRVRFIEGD